MTIQSILRHPSPVASSKTALRPLGIDEVTITGGYWGRMQQLNADHIIRHCARWIEKMGWIENFDLAAAGADLAARRRGPVFADSDVYKVLEAMAWELGRRPDAELETLFEAIVDRIVPAQEADGYLSTAFGRPGQRPRYSDLEWGHELYCYGHLIQAGIARARNTPDDDRLYRVALRAADHICTVFGADGNQGVCGHPEVEVALVELARHTGDTRYLDQARLFIDRRGHGALKPIPFGQAYFQDDVPVRETAVMNGHAVRANYLAAGAVDVAIEDADQKLLDALTAQVRRTDERRSYLTGGMGAHHEGESFGDDFELPPDRAYSETCAGVGSAMVHYRLLLATGQEEYADAIERVLYNVITASPASDGESFFYTNTLHKRVAGVPVDGQEASPRAASGMRAPWFEVSCCPPNVARTLAAFASYVATADADGIQLHQYASSEIATKLDDGSAVRLRVETAYPDDGRITVSVVEAPERDWVLTLRVPAWAEGAIVAVGGQTKDAAGPAVAVRGAAVGSRIVLDLPVAPRWTVADPRIDAVRGTVAVERGPLVMCLESVDLPQGRELGDLRVVPEAGLRESGGTVAVPVNWQGGSTDAWPYFPANDVSDDAAVPDVEWVPLLPYHDWANRGPATMRVWLPVA